MRRWLGDAGAAALTTGVVTGLLSSAGGIWQRVGGDDLHGYLLPHYVETARAIVREGRLPLWNPYEYCGAPLLADPQGLAFYPPALLLFASLPPYWALQGFYACNVLVLSWGCIAYLRLHGSPRWAGAFAALVATAGMFNTPTAAGIDNPNFLAGVAWVPWILLCWQHAVQSGIRPWLGLLGLALAAQWFTGYPVFSMDTAVLFGVVALLSSGGSLTRRLMVMGAALALGVAVAAVQLVPLGEAVTRSVRAFAGEDYVRTRAFLAFGQTGMWRHQIFGVFGPGFPTLLLMALALVRPSRGRVAWAGAALWAAFALDPPLNLLYEMPPFSKVRYPYGWSHILPVFTGFLAASGATMLAERRRPLIRVLVGTLLVAATVRASATIQRAPTRGAYSAPDYVLLAERTAVLERVLAQLAERPRTFGNREMHGGTYLREHLASGAGYTPSMPPAGPLALITAVNGGADIPGGTLLVYRHPRLARLLGIGLVSVPPFRARLLEREGFRPVGRLPPDEHLLYQEPVPRARLVDRVFVEPDDEAMLRRTLDPARDLIATAVVRAADAPRLAQVSPGPPNARAVRIVEDAPERVAVEAHTQAPALLVLADTYDPGWVATLDGATVSVLRVDHTFRAVVLPAGAHRVEFRYRPAGLRRGAAISAAALLVTVGLIVPWRRKTSPG